MRVAIPLGALLLAAGILAGCGEKETPPLTPDQLPANMKATGNEQPAAGGTQFSRPEANPNAKFKPTR